MSTVPSSAILVAPLLLGLLLLTGCESEPPAGGADARGGAALLRHSPPPGPQVFCTHSLGVADCWSEPEKLPNRPRENADGPRSLTPEQERNRTAWWNWHL
jgi:hypothetical protein